MNSQSVINAVENAFKGDGVDLSKAPHTKKLIEAIVNNIISEVKKAENGTSIRFNNFTGTSNRNRQRNNKLELGRLKMKTYKTNKNIWILSRFYKKGQEFELEERFAKHFMVLGSIVEVSPSKSKNVK